MEPLMEPPDGLFVQLVPTIVRQFRKWSNRVHKKLPHLICFALATNYFNVFMSTTVLLGLKLFEKIGGQWIWGGAVTFQTLLAPGPVAPGA